MFGEGAEPTEPVGIAPQVAELTQLWKVVLEIQEEVAGDHAITGNRYRLQCNGESLKVGFKDVSED
jgi:hypothetical protein